MPSGLQEQQTTAPATSAAASTRPRTSIASRPSTPAPAEAERILQQAAAAAHRTAERRAQERSTLAEAAATVQLPTAAFDEETLRQMEQEQAARRQQDLVNRLIQASGIPPRYAYPNGPQAPMASLAQAAAVPAPPEVRQQYLRVAEALGRLLEEPGVIGLLGPRGVGKTWMACALALDFCRRGRSARWLHAMDYFIGLKETYDSRAQASEARYERDHLRPHLLVLDEVHERGDTSWEDRQLIRLVTKRHELRLATVLISNQTREMFIQRMGDSIVDRMNDDAGGICVCGWASLRGRAEVQR